MTLSEFEPWPKIPRLRRDIVVTEKIDGTNAAVVIDEEGVVRAQSRSRIVTPEDDNFGFARWTAQHADNLRYILGPGRHFGEWWGAGIQRRYGLAEKRFSLFNTKRWAEFLDPDEGTLIQRTGDGFELHVVPVLGVHPWDDSFINGCLDRLRERGSVAAPGFADPEGIIVFHPASGSMFKQLLKGDDVPKGAAA